MSAPVTRGVSRLDINARHVTRADVLPPAAPVADSAPLAPEVVARINAAVDDWFREQRSNKARTAMIDRLRNGWRNPER